MLCVKMYGMTMAGLAQRLDESERSNTRLRKMLRKERAMHLEKETEKDDELLQLRTQIAKLEDRLKSALARKKKHGPMGGKSGKWKRLVRPTEVIDSSD